MKKRLYVYLGVVIFTLILVIISAVYESAYRVYLLPEAAPIFSSKAKTSEDFGTNEESLAPKATHELNFCGKTVMLTYNEQLSNEMHAYTSIDGVVNCWYDTHTGKIRLLSAEKWFSLPEGSEVTEETCLNWLYEQVAPHYTESWDSYARTCATTVLSLESGAPQQLQRDGFVLPDEGETVMAYTFTFRRMIGQFGTSDIIQAYIHPGNGFAAVEFSAHKFDDPNVPEVDMNRLGREIKTFLRRNINENIYTYVRHELRQPTFAYINNTLCMVCSVSVVVESETGMQTFDQQLAIIIR